MKERERVTERERVCRSAVKQLEAGKKILKLFFKVFFKTFLKEVYWGSIGCEKSKSKKNWGQDFQFVITKELL